jgi:predicted RNase H-like HicB family nuclease
MSDHVDQDYGRYSMIVEWEPQDRIYVVTIPELSGCRTHGATLEEAVRQGRDAYESWVDVSRELGWPIPPPKYFDLDGPNPPGWGR